MVEYLISAISSIVLNNNMNKVNAAIFNFRDYNSMATRKVTMGVLNKSVDNIIFYTYTTYIIYNVGSPSNKIVLNALLLRIGFYKT